MRLGRHIGNAFNIATVKCADFFSDILRNGFADNGERHVINGNAIFVIYKPYQLFGKFGSQYKQVIAR